MVKGMSAERVPFLTSRICGICSISHALASIRALERAMLIARLQLRKQPGCLPCTEKPCRATRCTCFLAAPDFAGTSGVLPLLESQPELVRAGLGLKELGNEISAVTTGRCTHPVSLVVEGSARRQTKFGCSSSST